MKTFRNSTELGVQGQKTLPARAYLDPALFADEQQRIFARHWLCVARSTDVGEPGSYIVRSVAGESLIVLRDQEGTVRAHFNVCRHRGTRLCQNEQGRFSRTIQCPYHAWTYGLDGCLVGVPDERQLDGFSRGEFGLHPAGCGEWEGFVWVNVASRPEPLEQFLAPLQGKFADWNPAGLVRLGQRTYDVAANWKLIVQNYSECYHCPVIHPALVRLSPPTSGGNDLVEGPFLGGFMDVSAPGGSLTCSGRSCGATVGPLNEADRQRVYYYVLFPNLLLSLHHDYVMAHTLWPDGPGRTRIECQWLFHPDSRDTSRWNPEDGIEFWDQTNREDWHVSELTQLGVASSRYEPGPYSNREAMAAAFDRHWMEVMEFGMGNGTGAAQREFE